MRKYGIRQSGNEQAIEKIFVDYLKDFNGNNFYYLEIGCASCESMNSIYDIIGENAREGLCWTVNGLEISDWVKIDWCVKERFKHPLSIYLNGKKYGNSPDSNAILCAEDNPREWISKLPDESIDICFIDADHGYTSVQSDFLAVESKIKKNGILWFHDFCVLSQMTDWQNYSQDFINVRRACADLGLMDNKRNGWIFLGENLASRFVNGDGNGIGIFKKI